VGVGLFAAGGGLLRLPNRVGHSKAMEMALTGDPLTAEEAASLGLLARLTVPGRPWTPPSSWPSASPATLRWLSPPPRS